MAFVDLNDTIISQVRQSADLVEFVTQVTPLRQAGRSFKGLCPFHREKTPSFHVDRDKGLFYCFGCGTGGDIFKFLSLTERLTFPEAVELVANRAGIQLPTRKKERRDRESDVLLEIVEEAAVAFHQALEWKPNHAAAYLEKREIGEDVWNRYGLGYAPESWDYVLARLGGRYSVAQIEAAGLALPRKSGTGHYDRFRNRLIIPIHSDSGTLLGFGGRSLDGSDPKYLNSPESAVFNKSNLLYNLHRAKDAIRRLDRAILVEGYFDAIAPDHAGVPGVVASMGTSLTTGQASVLRRLTRKVAISYDGDSAGKNAALRASQVLLNAGLQVEIVGLGEGVDPDDVIRRGGADAFLELVHNASDVFSFALHEWADQPSSMNGREKAEVVEKFVPLLLAVPDPVVRNDAAQRVADHLRLEFGSVWSRVRGKAGSSARERSVSAPISSGEKELLRAILSGELPPALLERVKSEHFSDSSCRAIYFVVSEVVEAGSSLDFPQIAAHLKGEVDLTRLSELAIDDGSGPRDPGDLESIIREMERASLDRQLSQIQADIQEAEREGDTERVQRLDTDKLLLRKRFHALK